MKIHMFNKSTVIKLFVPYRYVYCAHIHSASVLFVYIHCQKSYIAGTTWGAISTVSVSFHCEVYMYMLHITYKLKLNNRGTVFHDAIIIPLSLSTMKHFYWWHPQLSLPLEQWILVSIQTEEGMGGARVRNTYSLKLLVRFHDWFSV